MSLRAAFESEMKVVCSLCERTEPQAPGLHLRGYALGVPPTEEDRVMSLLDRLRRRGREEDRDPGHAGHGGDVERPEHEAQERESRDAPAEHEGHEHHGHEEHEGHRH